MRARVQKWGNSLALRIPKPFAADLGLEVDSVVELTMEGDSLLVTPAGDQFDLESLLSGVTEHNLHGEVDTGMSVGREEW